MFFHAMFDSSFVLSNVISLQERTHLFCPLKTRQSRTNRCAAGWRPAQITSTAKCGIGTDPLATRPVLPKGTRVVVSGGTGFLGRALITRLIEQSAVVTVLARDIASARAAFRGCGVTILAYDAALASALDDEIVAVLDTADAVVNLAGEPIADGRWTSSRKRVLWDSRTAGTAALTRTLASSDRFCGVFVSASAVGYYGTSESKFFTEQSPPGSDFLSKLAKAWETAALRNMKSAKSARTVILRIGVALGSEGGALQKMLPAFRAFLGGPPGSGCQVCVHVCGYYTYIYIYIFRLNTFHLKVQAGCLISLTSIVCKHHCLASWFLFKSHELISQWFSWIHRDDVVDMIVFSIVTPSWSGIYNCTSPEPVRLRQFCDELAQVLHRANWLPVPAFAVKALLGSEAANLVLAGQHVRPERALSEGYRFRFSNVRDALRQILVQETNVSSKS